MVRIFSQCRQLSSQRPRLLLWLTVSCACLEVLAAAPLAPVIVAQPSLQAVVEEVPVSGTVNAPRTARLSPEVAGRVSTIAVDAGDRVEAGDTLLELDSTLAQLALAASAASSELAREELADARRRLLDAERLAKSRGIPETEVEARRSEVRADAATLKLREAEQQRERERLQRHTLVAPFAGVISRKLTEQGEWVTPGDPVLELIADRGLRIDIPVPQRYYPRIDNNARIELRFGGHPDRAVLARIGEIIPVSDPSARTFVIRAYPESTDLALIPGMSASGTLALGTGQQGLVVSRDAVLRHPDGRTTVWVVETTGDAGGTTVSERVVQTGLAFDGQVVVRSGIDADQRVVVEGNEALQQGQGVTIRAER
ncbi:MAG: efflux RND transporter periplasmic adaptor subunit [Gammaproteobacteria bacterium]|nr:efflux RND transporter periplasmic adaptor subunit [Gammaproteobacteria bacterium]